MLNKHERICQAKAISWLIENLRNEYMDEGVGDFMLLHAKNSLNSLILLEEKGSLTLSKESYETLTGLNMAPVDDNN